MGVDVARGVALIGMMSVHVLPPLAADGSVSWAYRISAGRASALFAVLAGLSLMLAYRPRSGETVEPGVRRGVMARAGFIAGVGLILGLFGSGVAVILVHYAVLFAVGTLFMRLGARALLVTGLVWLVVSPVAGQLLRPLVPPGPGPSPSVISLFNPLELVTTVVLTGYYPVLQWTGYLLIGMGLGRLPLRRPTTGWWLLVSGTVLAVVAKVVSAVLLGPAGGLQRLAAEPSPVAGRDLSTLLQAGLYGTTPTTSWWWLAVSAPHAGTPPDLLHTAGTAVALVGACLLVVSALRARWRAVVLPVAAAGSMTLTLYTLHVVVLAAVNGAARSSADDSPAVLLTFNVVLALAVATAWQVTGRRGPLEDMANDVSTTARRRAHVDRGAA